MSGAAAMHVRIIIFVSVVALMWNQEQTRADAVSSARGVLQRTIGQRASEFVLGEIPRENGLDVFVVEARDGKVTVTGSTGVAIARGAYEYLRRTCDCQVTWEGSHLPLPAKLPDFARTRVVCPNRYR